MEVVDYETYINRKKTKVSRRWHSNLVQPDYSVQIFKLLLTACFDTVNVRIGKSLLNTKL